MFMLHACQTGGCKVLKHFQSSISNKEEQRVESTNARYSAIMVWTYWQFEKTHQSHCGVIDSTHLFTYWWKKRYEITQIVQTCSKIMWRVQCCCQAVPLFLGMYTSATVSPHRSHKSTRTTSHNSRSVKSVSDGSSVFSSCHGHQYNLSDTTVCAAVSSLLPINLSVLQDDNELHCLKLLPGHQLHTAAPSQNKTSQVTYMNSWKLICVLRCLYLG